MRMRKFLFKWTEGWFGAQLNLSIYLNIQAFDRTALSDK